MSPGLGPLFIPPADWPKPPDVLVDIPAPALREQVCFYGLCLPRDDHSADCETHTALEVAAAKLHWKLRRSRDAR